MARKVQSQLLVSELTKNRTDALAFVRGEPRAEVYRKLIDDALPAAEREHSADLKRLDAVAAAIGTSRAELVEYATRDGYTLADLEGRKTYPRPSVKSDAKA
jgi:hypothetical protein